MEKTTSVLCPRIQAKLDKEKKEAANCFLMPSSNLIFQMNHKMDCLTIDMGGRTCTCRKWNMCGIPCFHKVSCIFFFSRMNAENFVNDCYKREAYLRASSGFIPPCVGERHWPGIE